MPDISMCTGTDCPLRDTCYRFTAKPGFWQSYFGTPPIEDGKCGYYWQTAERKLGKRLNESSEP